MIVHRRVDITKEIEKSRNRTILFITEDARPFFLRMASDNGYFYCGTILAKMPEISEEYL
jgi:hypothetical protein